MQAECLDQSLAYRESLNSTESDTKALLIFWQSSTSRRGTAMSSLRDIKTLASGFWKQKNFSSGCQPPGKSFGVQESLEQERRPFSPLRLIIFRKSSTKKKMRFFLPFATTKTD